MGWTKPRRSSLSADGRSAYVTGRSDDALAVFRRDLSTGRLEFVQIMRDGVAGVDGLAYATSVVVSPDGGNVFVAGYDANATATIYDQNGNALATASSVAQFLRLDLPATNGEPYFLKVEGTSRNLDLRLLNLVSVAGTEITVSGTPNADDFAFASNDTFLIKINDVDYEFEVAQYETIVFNGGSGADKVTITGGTDDEIARLFPDHGSFGENGYLVTANDVTTIIAHGGGGADSAFLYDSPGDDQFVSRRDFGRLSGVGFDLVAHDFMYNYGYATTADGGTDVARMEDAPEADKFKFDWPNMGRPIAASSPTATLSNAKIRSTSRYWRIRRHRGKMSRDQRERISRTMRRERPVFTQPVLV
jgi:hypothetical protein